MAIRPAEDWRSAAREPAHPVGRSAAAADPTRLLESALDAIVAAAGAYARTAFDFLFRARRFDARLAGGAGTAAEARARYLAPLSFLLLNQAFYFAVYPRQEEGPTRALIEALPGSIGRALDRIEVVLAEPDPTEILFVATPLVLVAALHALLCTWGFQRRHASVRFEGMLHATAYSVGTMLALVGLSAVLAAKPTELASSGSLHGVALAAYLIGLVAPFVLLWAHCVARHFTLVRAVTGATRLEVAAVVIGATLLLALLAGGLLALVGMRGGAPPGG